MITEDQAKEVLQTLSEAEGEELSFDGDCAIVSKEDRLINIHYDYEKGEIHIYGVIGQLPYDEDMSNKIIRYFMTNNFMWKNSFGATFALDMKNNMIILQKAYKEYEEIVDGFQNNLISFDYELGYWTKRLENLPIEIDSAEIDS